MFALVCALKVRNVLEYEAGRLSCGGTGRQGQVVGVQLATVPSSNMQSRCRAIASAAVTTTK